MHHLLFTLWLTCSDLVFVGSEQVFFYCEAEKATCNKQSLVSPIGPCSNISPVPTIELIREFLLGNNRRYLICLRLLLYDFT